MYKKITEQECGIFTSVAALIFTLQVRFSPVVMLQMWLLIIVVKYRKRNEPRSAEAACVASSQSKADATREVKDVVCFQILISSALYYYYHDY